MNAPAVSPDLVNTAEASPSLDIPLLGGKLGADDSRQYVLQMIHNLQGYHRKRNFSHQERFGEPDPLSESVLHELAAAFESAKQLIDQARDGNAALVIESSIKVKFAPQHKE